MPKKVTDDMKRRLVGKYRQFSSINEIMSIEKVSVSVTKKGKAIS